jgi:hypothetical protein
VLTPRESCNICWVLLVAVLLILLISYLPGTW